MKLDIEISKGVRRVPYPESTNSKKIICNIARDGR